MDRGKWKAIWDSLKLYCLYLFIPALLLLIGMTLRRGQITVDEFMGQSGDFYTVLGFGAAIAILVRRAKKRDRKSTRLNSSHITRSRMPSSA